MALCPKSVLITGANRGIGLEFVKQFLKLDVPPKFIFACCRQPDSAEDLKSIASGSSVVHIVKLDVQDQSTIDTAKTYVESKLEGQGLNLLINNAAVLHLKGFYDVTKQEMMDHFETNAVGPLIVSQTFISLLKQAAGVNPTAPMSCSRAAIINMSTGVASISENSSGGIYPYRASKAALNMLTSNMAIDLKGDGILVTAVHPGWVKTNMGGPNALIDTETSLKGIMSVFAKLQGEEGTGKFYHGVKGELIGW
ncbi:C-factor-like [Mya arenaria]|nr:C-factor-like [Mya arenaria]